MSSKPPLFSFENPDLSSLPKPIAGGAIPPSLPPLPPSKTFASPGARFTDASGSNMRVVREDREKAVILGVAKYTSSGVERGGFSIKLWGVVKKYTNSAAIVMVSKLTAMGILEPDEFLKHLSESEDGPALERQNKIAKDQSLKIFVESESRQALQDKVAALEAAKLFVLQWQALRNILARKGEEDWIKPISHQLEASKAILKTQEEILKIATALNEIDPASMANPAEAAFSESRAAMLGGQLSFLEDKPEIKSLKKDVEVIRRGAVKESPDATFLVRGEVVGAVASSSRGRK